MKEEKQQTRSALPIGGKALIVFRNDPEGDWLPGEEVRILAKADGYVKVKYAFKINLSVILHGLTEWLPISDDITKVVPIDEREGE